MSNDELKTIRLNVSERDFMACRRPRARNVLDLRLVVSQALEAELSNKGVTSFKVVATRVVSSSNRTVDRYCTVVDVDYYDYSDDMTPEEADRAYEESPAEPISDEELESLVKRATSGDYEESDACPTTGEEDCEMCSGEHCETHGSNPCDCDVAQRHGFKDYSSAAAELLAAADQSESSKKLLAAINGVRDDIDCDRISDVTCPWCGHVIHDSWAMPDSGDETCDQCGNDFEYEREVEVSYSSTRVDKVDHTVTEPPLLDPRTGEPRPESFLLGSVERRKLENREQ